MVVRMRHTRAHTKNRRSHHALKSVPLSSCEKCNASHLRHHACPSCGNYRGRVVTDVAAKQEKRLAKRAEKLQARAGTGTKEDETENKEENKS